MSGKDSKSIVQQAKLDLDSIVNLAKDNILKEHEDKIHKLIEEAMNEIELEDSAEKAEPINEMIKLETDDMKIVVDDDGSTKVEHKEEVPEEKTTEPVDAVTQEPVAAPATTTVVDATPEPVAVDAVGDEEEIELSSDEDEIQIANEVEQTQPMNQDPAPAAPQAAQSTQAPAPEAAPETTPEVAPEAAPEEDLAGELANIIGKMIAQQTGGSADAGTDGDEVSIVDDETEAGAVAPVAPSPETAAPAMEEMIELDEDDDLLEIELEDEEVVMDEVKAMGTSHALNKTAGPHTAPEVAVRDRTRAGVKINENTEKENAQYEAIIAELKNENKGLKGQIGEFRTAFIELREHYDEMQTFNQKLALAHRVIIQGGWTEKEKARISERFEAAKDSEDAKRIYKEIMSERSVPKSNDVIRSSAIPVVQSKKQPIYESEAAKRARVLAGIDTPNED